MGSWFIFKSNEEVYLDLYGGFGFRITCWSES